jgi:hypothetical protein
MNSLFEENGGTYSAVGDYRLPNLVVPDEPGYPIGLWGKRRLDYLKTFRRLLYVNLLISGKLSEHLHDIDVAAQERWENIIRQMAEVQGVSERLKAEDKMLWVGRMNNIRACADEIVRSELIVG